MHQNINELFVAGGGIIVAYTATEGTGTVRVGEFYRLSSSTACLVRFSGSAVAASTGNFDFHVEPAAPIIVQATNATIRAIQVATGGNLYVQRIDEAS